MNRQLSALPDSKTIRILLPYNRQYVIFAVYEVLDKNVNEQKTGTELTVTMIHPCQGLSDTGIRRATTAIADSISQHLENELVINKVSAQRQPV